MDIDCTVRTEDWDPLPAMLDKSDAKPGDSIEISPGARVVLTEVRSRDGEAFLSGGPLPPETIQLTITVASSIGAGIVANWLYDKLSRGRRGGLRITIEGTHVRFEPGEIQRVIQEKIAIEPCDASDAP